MTKNSNDGERMARIETDITYIKAGIDEMKESFRKHIESCQQDTTNFREECDKRYASKWSERIVYGMVGIILASFLYFAINHFWK